MPSEVSTDPAGRKKNARQQQIPALMHSVLAGILAGIAAIMEVMVMVRTPAMVEMAVGTGEVGGVDAAEFRVDRPAMDVWAGPTSQEGAMW
jgi:hypothetical protein